MPLSEHEQRLLEQIEQALYADDPKFASAVRSARSSSQTRKRLVLCVIGVLVGLATVLGGMATQLIPLGVVGFVIIVASCGYAAHTLRNRPTGGGTRTTESPAGAARGRGLRSKMEDRMRRRFDEEQ